MDEISTCPGCDCPTNAEKYSENLWEIRCRTPGCTHTRFFMGSSKYHVIDMWNYNCALNRRMRR